jgi:hypothetical protein
MDLPRILQIMQRHAEDVGITVHRGAHAVEDAEPAMAGPEGRGPGADLVGEGRRPVLRRGLSLMVQRLDSMRSVVPIRISV